MRIGVAKRTYRIEVVDVVERPQLSRGDPPPMRKIIGDVSDTERVLVGVGLAQR